MPHLTCHQLPSLKKSCKGMLFFWYKQIFCQKNDFCVILTSFGRVAKK